jgi:hypothetical protein
MIDTIRSESEIVVVCKRYSFRYPSIDSDHFEVLTKGFAQQFFIPASCDSLWDYDITSKQLDYSVEVFEESVQLRFAYSSNLWHKIYYVDLYEEHLTYYYELQGNNQIDTLRFFEGIVDEDFAEHFYLTKHFNDKERTNYREYRKGSPVSFSTLFCPEPNSYNKQYFEYFEYSQISVNSDLDYCGGNFVSNPSLLCFAVSANRKSQVWLSLGLAVEPGQYLFSEYEYWGGVEFGLNLNYWGGYEAKGHFCTPKVIICLGDSEYNVLQQYADFLRQNNIVPTIQQEIPTWWNGPIICGWGHQCYQGDLFRVRSPSDRGADSAAYLMSNQPNYEAIVNKVTEYELEWKILIIDAKWAINAGLKTIDVGRWPDMRAFVESLHRKDKKVLIWWGPWDVEGWPDSECITYSKQGCGNRRNRKGRLSKFVDVQEGMKIAPDTTLPSVREKIASQIEYLLSPSGVDLDGFKVDHVAATPGVYGMVFPQGSRRLSGIELLHDYHQFIYTTAKRIKPDSLIIGQSPNPYFSDCIDMIRLGDIYSPNRCSIVEVMDFRLKVAKIANPYWLVDMDGWPIPSINAFREYMKFQTLHGVPSLYYITHLDTTGEMIPENVFSLIKELWLEYRQAWQD